MLLPQVFVSFYTMTCFLVMTLLRDHGRTITFQFRKAHKRTPKRVSAGSPSESLARMLDVKTTDALVSYNKSREIN